MIVSHPDLMPAHHKNPVPASCLIWFREDLRLTDNPALCHAVQGGKRVVAIFINETPGAPVSHLGAHSGPCAGPGAAARWWMHQNLTILTKALAEMGIPLILREGAAAGILPEIAGQLGADEIIWARRYGPYQIAIDKELKSQLTDLGHAVHSFNARLLCEPWKIASKAGTPFRVFTPFWKALKSQADIRTPLPAPSYRQPWPENLPVSDKIEDWRWSPVKPDWARGFADIWEAGEMGAERRLVRFIEQAAARYKIDRNIPGKAGTSGLSPYLQIGNISAVMVWHRISAEIARGTIPQSEADIFLSELAWREFSHHLLYHNPQMLDLELQPKFRAFPWRPGTTAQLQAWQQGQTGYPIIDAGMRELWQTGYMHNRLRMVVGSFLVKHLLVDWRVGMRWFWDTLLDADIASNTASWQWIAGCGADAAPYFRIFNPMLQGNKFDPAGCYVRRFVPEIARLPDKFIHTPWQAPADMLAEAGIVLGKTYPQPIVDHATARAAALAAYGEIKA